MAKMVAAVIVCVLVLALDITAGILGLQAQAAQNKTKKVTVLFIQCEKPVYKAYQLGLAAAVLLVVAHAVANFLGGCACICSQVEFIRASINRKLAATLIVLSWIALIVGFSLLLAGAMSNSKSKTSCGFVHGKTLALGGIMCFVHAGITIAYYVTATAAAHEIR
ncbi:protein DESIGUAL 3-like [Lolium rigidum]|uniref:protein DESIGUAL 3-like n=1 Tax=Lolium rigidum TaxID=89674 RepID=UPI001F5D1864|nr:protein DESIGUAL 3-like [Lolium rigidum]XP_051200888.1 protein VASCULATURE COMPLEXITY AND CONNECTIVITY-like [Lolium perenne]